MDLEKMKKIVRGRFRRPDRHLGQRRAAPGTEGDVYDLVIKCVDFSAEPKPKVIYDRQARTNSVSEIPHLYVKQMLDALYGRQPITRQAPNPLAEEAWKRNANLVTGDFEHGSGRRAQGLGKCRRPAARAARRAGRNGLPRRAIPRTKLFVSRSIRLSPRMRA